MTGRFNNADGLAKDFLPVAKVIPIMDSARLGFAANDASERFCIPVFLNHGKATIA